MTAPGLWFSQQSILCQETFHQCDVYYIITHFLCWQWLKIMFLLSIWDIHDIPLHPPTKKSWQESMWESSVSDITEEIFDFFTISWQGPNFAFFWQESASQNSEGHACWHNAFVSKLFLFPAWNHIFNVFLKKSTPYLDTHCIKMACISSEYCRGAISITSPGKDQKPVEEDKFHQFSIDLLTITYYNYYIFKKYYSVLNIAF